MQQDYLDQLGELALGSRLKRMSERMMADAASIYQDCGLDVQPKWFTLLALLANRGQVSVVEAADMLGLSQPAVSQFCRQLKSKGLIGTSQDQADSRRTLMALTDEGDKRIAQMQPMWDAVHLAANDLCSEFNNAFYAALQKFERAFEDGSLRTRAQQYLKAEQPLSVVPYRPELAHHFDSINREWITNMFSLEEIDENVISQPDKYVIQPGGKIWFARHPELGIVGTCALMKKSEGVYELTKMGVLEQARGLKVGEFLLRFVIDAATKMGVKTLFLLTNRKCEAAIHLYQKAGFEHDAEIMANYGCAYQRCDVAMRYC